MLAGNSVLVITEAALYTLILVLVMQRSWSLMQNNTFWEVSLSFCFHLWPLGCPLSVPDGPLHPVTWGHALDIESWDTNVLAPASLVIPWTIPFELYLFPTNLRTHRLSPPSCFQKHSPLPFPLRLRASSPHWVHTRLKFKQPQLSALSKIQRPKHLEGWPSDWTGDKGISPQTIVQISTSQSHRPTHIYLHMILEDLLEQLAGPLPTKTGVET